MFLFIFESIGTSELILVGIIALIFLGPRKLPDIARKAGKIMAEFRGTANEFKETWQREVDFEEETKAFDLDTIEAEVVARDDQPESVSDAPAVKEIDPSVFNEMLPPVAEAPIEETPPSVEVEVNDKQNWL